MTLKELKKVTEEKNVRNLIVNGFRFEHSKGNYAIIVNTKMYILGKIFLNKIVHFYFVLFVQFHFVLYYVC